MASAASGPVAPADDGRTVIGIAIDIPEPWGGQLTGRRAAAGDPLAASIPAHLTLLGPTEVATDELPAVDDHLAGIAAAYPPFTVHLRGTGTFRPVTEVVFVTVAAGISECERLHQAVLAAPAVRRTQRFPYHPHVTVAHNVPGCQLDAVFADLAGFEAVFRVAGFTLFEHGADGRWHPRREFPLRGTTAGAAGTSGAAGAGAAGGAGTSVGAAGDGRRP